MCGPLLGSSYGETGQPWATCRMGVPLGVFPACANGLWEDSARRGVVPAPGMGGGMGAAPECRLSDQAATGPVLAGAGGLKEPADGLKQCFLVDVGSGQAEP